VPSAVKKALLAGGVLMYIWFAAVNHAPEVRARKAARRAQP
jgi:hypothetical protein